jgi:hypothetical protein
MHSTAWSMSDSDVVILALREEWLRPSRGPISNLPLEIFNPKPRCFESLPPHLPPTTAMSKFNLRGKMTLTGSTTPLSTRRRHVARVESVGGRTNVMLRASRCPFVCSVADSFADDVRRVWCVAPLLLLSRPVHAARNLANRELVGKMDPFCVLHLSGSRDEKFKTKVVKDGHQNPIFEQSYIFNLGQPTRAGEMDMRWRDLE